MLGLMQPTQQKQALTVSDYSGRLVRAVGGVGRTVIEGEVQSPRMSNGMLWLSLTDGSAVLPCKVFQTEARRLEHVPRTGDIVRVQVDRPDWFGRTGQLHLIVSRIRLAGEGQLRRQRQDLIQRLAREGLCDQGRWRRLPRFPRAIGVIAGKDSDGMSDVLRALQDRWPPSHIVTCTSLVQGAHAPAQLIDSLARLQGHPLVDVIILARGGGSVQDLACFDDEGLCRALSACQLPVVCAVGHTDNVPVANHVTWSATTPSRSAELVVPNVTELRHVVRRAADQTGVVTAYLNSCGERVRRAGQHERYMSRLDARSLAISTCTESARVALDGQFRLNADGLRHARTILNASVHRSERRLGTWGEQLTRIAGALLRTRDRVDTVAVNVSQSGDALARAVHRQARNNQRSCLSSMKQLLATAGAALHLRSEASSREVAREGTHVANSAGSRIDDAQRDASHVADVVAARDFRRRGWLLASTQTGQPISAADDLSPGQPVRLQLIDGSAEALITSTQPTTRSTTP